MTVPSDTRSLLKVLEETYKDEYDVENYDTKEYWKKAGVIELIRLIRYEVGSTNLNNVSTKD